MQGERKGRRESINWTYEAESFCGGQAERDGSVCSELKPERLCCASGHGCLCAFSDLEISGAVILNSVWIVRVWEQCCLNPLPR